MLTNERMTDRLLICAVLAFVAFVAPVTTMARLPMAYAAADKARTTIGIVFTSPEEAYDQGFGAVRAGRPELAVTAFEFAGNNNHVPALYYLGALYANNDDRVTDHAKAFNIFHRIVEKYAYVDPLNDFRSVYVVRAAVRLAGYYRSGVPALGLKPDPREAVELLNHAATYFGDLEAQFQLAKMHLTGEGVEGNERYGLHWLSSLARKNHPGAQAFLAELLWRGKFVQRDPHQALVWSTLSMEGAGDQDRIWIEEIYQTVYCGAAPGVREKAGQLVADWRHRAPAHPQAGSPADHVDRAVVTERGTAAGQGDRGSSARVATVRTCANGEAVPPATPAEVTMPSGGRRGDSATAPGPIPGPLPVIDKHNPRGSTSAAAGKGPVTPASGPSETAPLGNGTAAAGATAGAGRPSEMRSVGSSAPPFGQGFREFEKNETESVVRGRR